MYLGDILGNGKLVAIGGNASSGSNGSDGENGKSQKDLGKDKAIGGAGGAEVKVNDVGVFPDDNKSGNKGGDGVTGLLDLPMVPF